MHCINCPSVLYQLSVYCINFLNKGKLDWNKCAVFASSSIFRGFFPSSWCSRYLHNCDGLQSTLPSRLSATTISYPDSSGSLVTRRDSEELEFYYRRISAVKQCKPLRGSQSKQFFFESLLATTRSPKSQRTLGTRLSLAENHV